MLEEALTFFPADISPGVFSVVGIRLCQVVDSECIDVIFCPVCRVTWTVSLAEDRQGQSFELVNGELEGLCCAHEEKWGRLLVDWCFLSR